MDFIPVLDTFESDNEAVAAWKRILSVVSGEDGLCFYKHPSLGAHGAAVPDFVLLARGWEPVVFRVWRFAADDIEIINDDRWVVSGAERESPLLELDDFRIRLQHRFENQRALRGLFRPAAVLVTPHMTRHAWAEKLGAISQSVLAKDDKPNFPRLSKPLTDEQWSLAKSVFESAHVLRPYSTVLGTTTKGSKIGEAIRLLERQITLLDSEQLRAALQLAPGPQRLRGLAGTGKTVLLAMRAATIHQHYPDARVLFTFHTQSLYNQARRLISDIYRDNVGEEPNWSNLHVRHSWGSKRTRPGVYSELCARLGINPLPLEAARQVDAKEPLGGACRQLLNSGATIAPYYDYVLVDEAQDLPNEFLHLLYDLAKPPHRICFAYDELQTLTDREPRDPTDMFGVDADQQPRVNLDGTYSSGIEKDLVLFKAYRSPLEILMLAHGLGLGIHGPRGPLQMLANVGSWKAVGYIVEGDLETGKPVAIRRPVENSPNPLSTLYSGDEPTIVVKPFDTLKEELVWVADDIRRLIEIEKVLPHHIAVITFQAKLWKDYLVPIQQMLLDAGIPSVIPGLLHSAAEFGEEGRVTLSTPFRAKGNELPVVYIIGLEQLHSFAEEIESRNSAFTSISRAKGWVKISGSGPRMRAVYAEIERLRRDAPYFRFVFPDMQKIQRSLEATETTRRRQAVALASSALEDLVRVDRDALVDLDPEKRRKLLELLLASDDQGEGDAAE